MDEILKRIESRLGSIDERLGKLEARGSSLENRYGLISQEQMTQRMTLGDLVGRIAGLGAYEQGTAAAVQTLGAQLGGQVSALTARVDFLTTMNTEARTAELAREVAMLEGFEERLSALGERMDRFEREGMGHHG